MRKIVLAFTAFLCLAWVPHAGAAAPANTSYGGGWLVDQPPRAEFPGHPGDADVALRTNGDGTRATVASTLLTPCRGGTSIVEGHGRARVADDGAFTLRSRRRSTRRGFVVDVTIRGGIEGPRATGEITGRLVHRRTGATRCDARAAWTSVVPPAQPGPPAAAPAGALLAGIVRTTRRAPFTMLLRTTPDASAITRLLIVSQYNCRGRSGTQSFSERGGPVSPDGTFRIVNRFTVDRPAVRERVAVRIEGRFVQGGATGTVTVTAVARRKRGGRVAYRCRSGRQGFDLAQL
ncbi:MAG TPA: hypothetical protein VHF89_19670 [Solirubrobacteraceae bacterium]|nr:hypothetical protein [Solirubrobacteraceae bacterium]